MSTLINQLERTQPSLPSHYYFEPEHFQRELQRIWYRHWLCVGRSQTLRFAGDFLVVEVGDQSVVVTKDEDDCLRAFHNTCRHRGSLLCEQRQGRFKQGRIVCPYHAWTYSLRGQLVATPWRLEGGEFDGDAFSLYEVAVGEWGGFVFINLEAGADAFEPAVLGEFPSRLTNWRLEDAVVAHETVTELECNWKVFWENFSECYHCPGVHPELCRVVPMYGQGLAGNNVVRVPGSTVSPMADGALTWTVDGQTDLPGFDGLTDSERAAGHSFGVSCPGGYFVTHVDYARAVQVLPLAPERTRLTVSWLCPPDTLEHPAFALDKVIELGELVVRQDGRACELNQKGLRCNRHRSGVLVGQETGVLEFQTWVRRQLDANE